MGSFNLILTDKDAKQQEYLDTASPLAQFPLMLSHYVDTSISYRVTTHVKVDSMEKLGNLLADISQQ